MASNIKISTRPHVNVKTKPIPKTSHKSSLFAKKPTKKRSKGKQTKQASTVMAQKKAEREAFEKEKRNSDLNPVLLMRRHLTGPAKLIGDGELQKLVDMDTSLSTIQKRMKNRMMYVNLCMVAGLMMGVLMKQPLGGAIGGIALGGLMWMMDMNRTNVFYRDFALKRQLAFAQFTRLAAAYLPELAHGSNLYSVFKKLLPRMGNERDRAALEKLMIDMQQDPEDQGPFLTFAHEFSVSDRAELIMLSIQQMYLGDVDDRNIRTLADDANTDMMRQVDAIIDFKIKKFNNIATKIGMSAMIVVFGFFGLLLVNTFSSTFGQAMHAAKNGF